MNESDSKKKLLIGGVVAALLVSVVALYFWPKSEEKAEVAVQPAPPPKAEPEVNYPVPPPKSDAAALPALEDSDSLGADLFAQLFGNDAVQALLVKSDIVRHFVVTIDNLPRKKFAERLKPIKPIAGKFAVTGPEGAQTIANENAARYASFVRLVDMADTQALAAAYFKVYPLLQQAYVDLGYPNGHFNNRLVEVIDHLLATPNVQTPIQVVQPNVMFEYADPQLEGLSAGQKALIRIGPAHAAIVKRKLRELRAAVTAKGPG
jgi:hypothetical protein